MKLHHIKNSLLTVLLIIAVNATAQVKQPDALSLGPITPYAIEVTYDKTSHIIFPAGIRYVDLGSDYIVAGKADDADNVLRVKAATKGFDPETNFSIITEDGNFYSFNACYSDSPWVMSYNLASGQTLVNRSQAADVRFVELGKAPASVTELLMERLYEKDQRTIKDIRSDSYGITFSLRGIYVHEGKYYFHTQIDNGTYVPFVVDFARFKVVDRKVAKRTVVQERTLIPLRTYKPLLPVNGNADERNIFLLDVFTLTKGQVLLIEVFEKNGGRGQVLRVKNSDLLKAKPISKLKFKF
ncbi:conjugative transposon protein TraN [Flavobacterium zepuense]|uniref:Conjugative transposon protein TraN n=1 Tax=Flavobacterium zepuense TaxID=2593302 RepID=A0A552UZL8_9FLAO|nr:conjugative transposon protein TraN [Flavobacterium zepuense]TRW23658.1 conjugative transposon protein TraN [Flavobacterium zepuense]